MCNGDEIQICWCCIVLKILIDNQAAYIDNFFNIFVQIRYNFEKLFQELCQDEQDRFRFDVFFFLGKKLNYYIMYRGQNYIMLKPVSIKLWV